MPVFAKARTVDWKLVLLLEPPTDVGAFPGGYLLVNGEVDLVRRSPLTLRVIHTPVFGEERQYLTGVRARAPSCSGSGDEAMPTRSPKPCAWPGRAEFTYSTYCAEHERAKERQRGSSAHARGYTYRWHRASRVFLELRPLCADPYGVHGAIPAPAEVVDHILPHRGDERLFWDRENWQPLCRSCHSRKTVLEDGGFSRG